MNTAALMTRVYWASRAIAGLAAALDATIFAILPKRQNEANREKRAKTMLEDEQYNLKNNFLY
jgi:hypothetical protein